MVRQINPRQILRARLGANMSQGDLAHEIRDLTGRKTSERSVRNWETGANVPHGDVIPAIAQATTVDISFLYEDEEAPTDEDSRAMRLARIRIALETTGREDLLADLESLAGVQR
jgi:transcriptional regulator with XRE-family HTH domain